MTKANVFIIESLDFDDEQNNRYEGRLLSQILHLGGKESAYRYIQTEDELKKALRLFEASRYRYLHLSCHGSEKSISTTLDDIPFPKLGELFKPYLRNRRLFISACSAVNEDLAKAIISSSKCTSIMGPIKRIFFSDAAIIWAAFYHLVFTKDPLKMKRKNIWIAMQDVSDTFGVPIDYFYKDEKKKKGFTRKKIRRRTMRLKRIRRKQRK